MTIELKSLSWIRNDLSKQDATVFETEDGMRYYITGLTIRGMNTLPEMKGLENSSRNNSIPTHGSENGSNSPGVKRIEPTGDANVYLMRVSGHEDFCLTKDDLAVLLFDT